MVTYDASTPLQPFIEARGRFYREIAKWIWRLDELGLTTSAPSSSAAPAKRNRYGVRIQHLVEAGLINAGDRLIGQRLGRTHYARVLLDGTLDTEAGLATSLSRAMQYVVGSARDPWGFWQVEQTGDRLDAVRHRYLQRFGR